MDDIAANNAVRSCSLKQDLTASKQKLAHYSFTLSSTHSYMPQVVQMLQSSNDQYFEALRDLDIV